jgi:hypothetical protein
LLITDPHDPDKVYFVPGGKSQRPDLGNAADEPDLIVRMPDGRLLLITSRAADEQLSQFLTLHDKAVGLDRDEFDELVRRIGNDTERFTELTRRIFRALKPQSEEETRPD